MDEKFLGGKLNRALVNPNKNYNCKSYKDYPATS